MQIVFHIDINAFYASAEAARDDQLIGKPLVICGKSKRSIITTASYEARAFGIHSAMPLFQAEKLCKNLLVKPVDFPYYRSLSNQFFTIIASFSEQLEVASIDECYVDMTAYIVEHGLHPVEVAKLIQKQVLEQIKLHISIGIAPNKFLAKMASDMQKPAGITILTKSNLKEKLWPLEIKEMFGVGKKTQPKLIAAGITTIADIANPKNYDSLKLIVGKQALLLQRKANGIDHSKINSSMNQLKSVGNSTTLEVDTSDEQTLYSLLASLANQVSTRAIKRSLISNTISITIKYTRFESISRQAIYPTYTNDYEIILSMAKRLFDEHYDGRPVRLLGISLHNTIEKRFYQEQLSIFDTNTPIQSDDNHTIDLITNLNKMYDHPIVTTAAALLPKKEIQKKYIEEE